MKYAIRYVYISPSGAGPFKGKAVVDNKYTKGECYYGPFGVAVIVSCSKVKVVQP